MKYLIALIVLIFSTLSFAATKECVITSGQIDLILATNEVVFEHKDEESHFKLTKEYSYNQTPLSVEGGIFKYVITYLYDTRDYPLYYCIELPEIGNWSVVKYIPGDVATDKPPIARLECKPYNKKGDIKYDFSLWPQDHIIIGNDGIKYHAYPWAMNHFGNRPSIENPCQIRFNKKILYEHQDKYTIFTIFLVEDAQNDYSRRLQHRFDDIYLVFSSPDAKNTLDIMSYVVPRIYFVKLEKDSIRTKYPDWHYDLYFTLIVQHSLSDDGTSWEYHRIEILKESGQASYITINDLGPISRAEWEPGWPDPATTPLWVKEPKD